jgi:hypothetical protein
MKYFVLGLDIFLETVEDEVIFAYTFKDGLLTTRFEVSDNVRILAEEVKDWEYKKQLDRRILFFGKNFK